MAKKNWKNRQNRTRLGIESLESRWNPSMIAALDPTNNFLDITVRPGTPAGTAHTVTISSITNGFTSGIFVQAVETATPANLPLNFFLDDATIASLGAGVFQGVRVTTDPGVANDVINAGALTFSNVGHKLSLVNSGDGADVITGSAQDDVINGGGGNDTINGGGGNDTINGDAGNDSINGGDGNDTVDGGTGADTINGDAGNDSLSGGTGNDTITGGTGQDRMFGGADFDLVCADTADFTGGGITDTQISGGSAEGTLPAPLPNPRYSQSDVLQIISSSGDNVGSYTNTTFEVIQGGDGNETITSNNAGTNVELYGNNGNDTLSSTSLGNDSLSGGAGSDNLSGGDGADALSGDGANTATPLCQTLPAAGAAGNDFLAGGNGNDVMQGGDGNDTLQGGAGADSMNDTSGNDWLDYSENNAGVFVILGNQTGDTPNTATVFANGNAAGDSTSSAFENINGSQGDDFLQGNNIGNVINGNDGADTVYGAAGNDSMNGGNGNDLMYGDGGNDEMNGNADDDALEGGDGNDLMRGSSGNDVMEGQRGTDTMNGGTGNDVLDGGLGNDIFVLDFGNTAVPQLGITASPSNDPLVGGLNAADEYWGGAGRDEFQVYGAWNPVLINPAAPANPASWALFTNNVQVNDVIGALNSAALAGRTDYFSGIDRLTINPDFLGAPNLFGNPGGIQNSNTAGFYLSGRGN